MEHNSENINQLFTFDFNDIHFIIRTLILVLVLLGFFVFVSFIYKLLRDAKTKQKNLIKDIKKDLVVTVCILLALWVIEAIWVEWIDHSIINIVHIFYEFFLIVITFILLFAHNIKKDFWNENLNFAHLELKLNKKLSTISKHLYALSVDDFNNFFEPLGFWYITEQARILKNKIASGVSINAKRIIVIEGNIDDNELLRKAFGPISKLTFSQKNMKNIDLLHELFNIKLYLLPKNVLKGLITNNNLITEDENLKQKRFNKIIEKKIKQLERLIIDDEMVFPRKEGNEFKLTIENNSSNRKSFIIDLFENRINNFNLEDYYIINIKKELHS